jgi:catechol 2,3-dioxygenase-like lactoylglutathione lyase family enzyme
MREIPSSRRSTERRLPPWRPWPTWLAAAGPLAVAVLLSLSLLAPALARSAALPAPAGQDGPITAVTKVGMTVEDADRSVAFFTGILDFQIASDREVAGTDWEQMTGVFGMRARIIELRLGDELRELTEYLTPRGQEVPRDSRSNDRWFQHVAIITSDMGRAYARLREHRVRHASTGPQRLPDWNPNAGGFEAFYFFDPDGHVLEILQFPLGKGDPRWQEGDRLFLGIDHTAIVVEDTDASLRFYRDRLGLRIAGESENYGDEQAHLNNVFGARLRITTLKAAAGPGVELLEYLAPRDGRPYPAGARPNDLFHWQTTLCTADADTALRLLRFGQAARSASGPGFVPQPAALPRAVGLIRDPDGHALQVVGD